MVPQLVYRRRNRSEDPD